MESYDVVIVGAGPAGLNCAKALAKINKKILLLEKNKIIGPKICAGGLTGHDLEYLKLPNKLLDFKFKEATIHTPFDKDIIKLNKYFGYTIDRKNLGQWQLSKLKNTKVIVKTNSKVTKIERDYIIINNSKRIRFKYLIGADGSTSIVRQHLGLKSKDMGLAIQYIIPSRKYKKLEIFLDSNLFGSWYAWVFPHKKYVSIGCGSNPKFLSSKRLQTNFNKWLKENKIDISKGKYQAFPINYDFRGYRFKNIFLIGDAAGLASGLTGEGIYQALISGEEIAKIIINKRYIPKKIKEIIKHKELHNRILHFLEKSGPLREVEYELLALLLKIKFIDKKLISILE